MRSCVCNPARSLPRYSFDNKKKKNVTSLQFIIHIVGFSKVSYVAKQGLAQLQYVRKVIPEKYSVASKTSFPVSDIIAS